MSRQRSNLAGRLLAVMVCAALMTPGLSCRTGAMGVRPAKSFVVPDWESLKIKSLAFMGMGSSVGDETARQTAQDLTEQALLSDQTRFVVLGTAETRARAASRDEGETCQKLIDVWRNSRTVDQFLAREFCQAISVDGLIFGELTDWKEEKVAWNIEGQSSTQVSLRLAIYSRATGELAWEAGTTRIKESLKYTPNEATGVYTNSQGVSRIERPNSVGPEPPKPEEVTKEVLRSILAAFPPGPPKS